MKTLYIIRHAKSSWEDPSLDDFDRPLNKRGNRDAPKMGKRLRDKGIQFDKIITSTANRAKTTAHILAKELNCENKLIEMDQLYDAMFSDFIEIISSTDNSVTHLALVSHNPTINNFVYHYFDNFHQNVPTCAIFAMEIETDDWTSFDAAEKHRLFFHYPKEDK